MPISYTYNTIFIHIPKCAGTTIEKMLGTATRSEYFSLVPESINEVNKTPQHYTYLELKNSLSHIDWKNFYLFSVIRNPYQRVVSEYKFREEVYLRTERPELNPIDFSTFLNSLDMDINKRISYYDGHLETQASYLRNEKGNIDPTIEIFRSENLKPCWDRIKELTGVEYSSDMWSRRSTNSEEYKKFYTAALQEKVYNFYKEDFDNFQYSKDL